jgi:hypothetical protein
MDLYHTDRIENSRQRRNLAVVFFCGGFVIIEEEHRRGRKNGNF